MELLEIDNSKRKTYDSCPRKYYYEYIRNLQRTTGSSAMRYGTVFHAAMEHGYEYIRLHGWDNSSKMLEAAILGAKKAWDEETALYPYFYDDYRNLLNCTIAVKQYFETFASDEGFLEVVSPEKAFKIKVTCNLTGFTFYFTGKIDLQIKLNGRIWGNEFKTSGYSIKQQTERIQRAPQIIGYSYGLKENSPEGELPDGFLTTLHYLMSKKKKNGEYGKLSIDFGRPPQVFSMWDIRQWRKALIATVKRIEQDRETQQYNLNYDNCYQYGRCTFLNLCEQQVPMGEESLEGYQERIPWNVLKTVDKENVVVTEESGDYEVT